MTGCLADKAAIAIGAARGIGSGADFMSEGRP